MLSATMATPKSTTRKPTTKPRAVKPKAPEPEDAPRPNALMEAAVAVQRKLLLDALVANDWSLTATAKALRLYGPQAVQKYIRTLELTEEYSAAKAAGKVVPGPRPRE